MIYVARNIKKKARNPEVYDREGKSRGKQTLASLGGEQMEPQEGHEEEERGREGEGEVKHTMLWGMAVGQTASALSSLWLW